MNKNKIIRVLNDIALYLDLKGENPFKSRAYARAAQALEVLDEDVGLLVAERRLEQVEGIGKALSEKITELVLTGKMTYFENLKASLPVGLLELLKVPGLGPKKVKVLYEKLNITDLDALETACHHNLLLNLSGFGERTQEKILKNIEYVRSNRGQYLYAEILPQAQNILRQLQSHPNIIRATLAGSLRRKKELVKDIDILVSTDEPAAVMDFLVHLEPVQEVVAKGDTKTSVTLQSGINVDVRAVRDDQFSYAQHHFTGSKEHNTTLRHHAKALGIKMNEYGLFKDTENIICQDEKDIFNILGLDDIPPELRENTGEIEAAARHQLPKLIEEEDIKGIFHVHTTYSDGWSTLEQIVETARKMGMQYIGIADHSQTAFYAGGLKPHKIKKQFEAIDILNKRYDDIHIFKGIESDILPDGSLDYDDDILKSFDFIVGSVHSHFNMSQEEMTARIIKAIQNPYMTMLGHPTGRWLLNRREYAMDLEAVLQAAAEHHVVIEINASPHRLDLDWRYLKMAKKMGLKTSINPDAHHLDELDNIRYGVATARKGWLEAEDVINTMDLQSIKNFLETI